MKSKSEMKRVAIQKGESDWHYCHDCQIARGGVVPRNQMGITVSGGTCSRCGKKGRLIPNADYHWPAKGKKAKWD